MAAPIFVVSSIFLYSSDCKDTHVTELRTVHEGDDDDFSTSVRALVNAGVSFITDDLALPEGELGRAAQRVVRGCVTDPNGCSPPKYGKMGKEGKMLFVTYKLTEEEVEEMGEEEQTPPKKQRRSL